jgi:hypothetical protein
MDREKQPIEHSGSSDCSSALWTVKRCEQLAKLERLIDRISMADKGSSFVRSFQDAEKLASELGDSRFPDRSFIQFLNDIAIESRRQHKERTGKLPD